MIIITASLITVAKMSLPFSSSDEELMVKPKFTMRKFCDICDVFDQHETDECPLQESGEDTGGIQHHGDRNHERPYCGICEGMLSTSKRG
jgi:hypothetical protein